MDDVTASAPPEIRASELTRFQRRLTTLEPAQAAAVEALTRVIVAKLLHEPAVNLNAGAGTPAGKDLAQGLLQLFALDA
jgi:glutamyl-tRNA reductase